MSEVRGRAASWTHSGDGLFARRTVLGGIGLGIVSAIAACSHTGGAPSAAAGSWATEEGLRLVGHRGAGDVVPEHTIEGYQAALGWGAHALELSVAMSSDGVLYCMHDLTLDRTTTLTGPVNKSTSAQIDAGRVDLPRCGSRWEGANQPRIPRLDDALSAIGDSTVLCIEAKDDAAYPKMVDTLQSRGLAGTVILKMPATSHRLQEAKSAGYRRFAYFGNLDQATPAAIAAAAGTLDAARDVLVIPASAGTTPVADPVLQAAKSSGIPFWVFNVHRRSEMSRFAAAGAAGGVVGSIGYVGGIVPPRTDAGWNTNGLVPGELTRVPDDPNYGITWHGDGTITLAAKNRQHFVTLGQLAPLATPLGPYTVTFDLRVDKLPSDLGSNISIAFGHSDDSYYEHRLGLQDGYHALMRLSGSLELYRHRPGAPDGQLLASASSPALAVGAWVPMRLEVTTTSITVTRGDTGSQASAENRDIRGSYMHIGRSAPDGSVTLRGLAVS